MRTRRVRRLGKGGGQTTSFHGAQNKGDKRGSYLRLMDFVYHSTLGLRVTKKKRTEAFHAGQKTGFFARCGIALVARWRLEGTARLLEDTQVARARLPFTGVPRS